MQIEKPGISALVPLPIWMGAVLMMLGACGDDDGGNEDTLFTGLSGLIIVALIIWFVARTIRNRR